MDDLENWLLSNNFCALPFFHTAIESNGDIKACCVSDVIRDGDGKPLNVNDMSLSEILSHPAYEALRESFRRGKKSKTCSACWKNNDKFSPRVKFSSFPTYREELQAVRYSDKLNRKLLWLEIKAGNRCNLKCRICGLHNSSQWLKDTYDFSKVLNETYPPFKSSPEWDYNQQCKWIDGDEFWNNTEAFDDITSIHIMGGEPMMVPEHKLLLRRLYEQGRSSKIEIVYNTNGTIKPDDELEDILRNFRQVRWALSIDDVRHRYEYQRKNGRWEDVESVLAYFEKPRHGWTCSIDPAVSIFNIYYLDEILEYFVPKGWWVGSNHFVELAFDIRALAPDAKDAIRNKYKDSKWREHPMIVAAMQYLQTDRYGKEDLHMRDLMVSKIDEFRNERFAETFPEMARIMGYE